MINDLKKYIPITNYQKFFAGKYDLNFTNYNFGFDWEIFKHLCTDVWAPFFTSKSYYRCAATARNTFKTTVGFWHFIFICCNFTDSSGKLFRRYANTHQNTSFGHLIDMLTKLRDNYGIDFLPGNKNKVMWHTSDNGGYIKFPSGGVISFGGYTVRSSVLGNTAKGSPILTSWTDEFVDPEEPEPLEEQELFNLYERLETSILKNQSQKRNNNPIKEWSWTYYDLFLQKEVTRYYHKVPFTIFTFNAWDKNHPFYKKYCEQFLKLSQYKEKLIERGIVWYEDEEAFFGLGIFTIRMTMKPTFNLLDFFMQKKILALKKNNIDEYNTVFLGLDYDVNNDSLFPFKKNIRNCKKYNINDFLVQENKMYNFDKYTVGVDWATGSIDKTVFLLVAYKYNDYNELCTPYIVEEIVITPNDKLSETEKTRFFSENIVIWFQNLLNFENSIFYYDDKCKSSMEHIKDYLFKNYNLIINIMIAKKHGSKQNQEASLIRRVIWLKFLFENKLIMFNNEGLFWLTRELEEINFDKTQTNVLNKKMAQDCIDALFYSIYPKRFDILSLNTYKK